MAFFPKSDQRHKPLLKNEGEVSAFAEIAASSRKSRKSVRVHDEGAHIELGQDSGESRSSSY